MSLAVALADLTVLDLDSRPVRMGGWWAERAAAIVWLRHYG